MTRNTLTKAKIILVYQEHKYFTTTAAITAKERYQAESYKITVLGYYEIRVDAADPTQFDILSRNGTYFNNYDDARRFIIDHKEEIRKMTKPHTYNGKPIPSNEIKVDARFTVYYNKNTKEKVYNLEETKKWGKNLFFIDFANSSINPSLQPEAKTQLFTVSKEENSL